MFETSQFNLPLVQSSQAQKHVTVNEALARLDAMAQLRLVSISQPSPPGSPIDGQAFGVPVGATGDWLSLDGTIAVFANGGWVSIAPKIGWQAWVEDESGRRLYDGVNWVADGIGLDPSGAATSQAIFALDHAVTAGADNLTALVIPAQTLVFGVTARVTTELVTDGATSWQMGVTGSPDRYGSLYGLSQNSFANALSGQPVAYYSDTSLLITPESGNLVSGAIRFAVHGLNLTPPAAV